MLGRRATVVTADLRYVAQAEQMVDTTVGQPGSIDILVNAAGAALRLPA